MLTKSKAMIENSKYNPTCIHGALDYLSEKTGIDKYVYTEYKSLDELPRQKNGKLAVSAWDISAYKDGVKYSYPRRQNRKGGAEVLVCHAQDSNEVEFPIDTAWDKIVHKKYRSVDDFGVKIESAGQYKYSLGGGWHSMVSMFKVGDFYFAYMECANH